MQKIKFSCVNCNSEYDRATYLCPECEKKNSLPPKGVLKILYNYDDINLSYKALKDAHFLPILPIEKLDYLSCLKVGKTPLYSFDSLKIKKGASTKLPFKLFLKDEGQNPTYSFKDRASVMVAAYAKQMGFGKIVAASTGNAGSSLAGICASTNQEAIIMVPKTAPLAKLTQILMYGAKLIAVDGSYDDAFDFSIRATKEYGWYNRNTAFNPITVEGKKSVSLELYGDLGEKLPDYVFVSVGDGCIISGVYKGFEDLKKLGIVDKIPKIVGVQSEKSANTINNIGTDSFKITPATTIADSISVDVPRNFYMTQRFLAEYDGDMIVVSDSQILEASQILSRSTGIFSEPAATCAFAGMLSFFESAKIPKDASCVVVLSGSGLKDLKSVQTIINMPKPIAPKIENLKSC